VRLEVEGAAPIDNPTPEQVEQGLRWLESAGRDYAILEQRASNYLQTAPNGDGAYLLEYQEGSPDQHFRASRPLPLDDVAGAFVAHLGQDAGWRSRYDWEKVDLTPRPTPTQPHHERRQMSRSRVAVRLAVGLVWGLAQIIILGAFLVGGGLVGALGFLFAPSIYGLPLSIGFVGGVLAALVVNHHSRMWLLQLRLGRLRRRGQQVEAGVVWVDEHLAANPRGPGTMTYTVFLRWQDPAGGADHEYERQYRFWGRGSRQFEALVDEPYVPVLYAPSDPSRFVIDIPFAPTMADLVLSEQPGQVQPASAPARPARAASGATAGHRSEAAIVFYAVVGLLCVVLGAGLLLNAVQVARHRVAGTLALDLIIGLMLLAGAASSAQAIFQRTRAAPTQSHTGGGRRQVTAQRRTGKQHRPRS
jgi:hypothetical protein